MFLSDANRIERMILNLLSNAIKFTDKGHVHVQVKLVKELDDKNLIITTHKTQELQLLNCLIYPKYHRALVKYSQYPCILHVF